MVKFIRINHSYIHFFLQGLTQQIRAEVSKQILLTQYYILYKHNDKNMLLNFKII